MPIPTRLLNKQASVHRMVQTPSDTGDMAHSSVQVIPSVLIRITLNDKMVSMGRNAEHGESVVASHIGFILPSVNVLKGDLVTVDGVTYKVQYVEDNPGGVTDHHKELYMEAVE